jgi:hypothetical protein
MGMETTRMRDRHDATAGGAQRLRTGVREVGDTAVYGGTPVVHTHVIMRLFSRFVTSRRVPIGSAGARQ